MKKVLFLLVLLCLALPSLAQIELTEQGAYEVKELVSADSVKCGVLFSRAMEALSDWSGPGGMAHAGIDYHDRDAGVVVYKGTYSLGAKQMFGGNSLKRTANFTLKVKCKDGRAQVTVTTHGCTATLSSNGMQREFTVAEMVEMVDNERGKSRKRGEELLKVITDMTHSIASIMSAALKTGSDDDF